MPGIRTASQWVPSFPSEEVWGLIKEVVFPLSFSLLEEHGEGNVRFTRKPVKSSVLSVSHICHLGLLFSGLCIWVCPYTRMHVFQPLLGQVPRHFSCLWVFLHPLDNRAQTPESL